MNAITNRKSWNGFVALALLGALLAGCAQPGGAGEEDELRGTITISGAWALYPMVVRWGEEFHALHPGVEFDISAGGAGKGMTDVLSGAVDIAMVSRAIAQAESDQGAFWVAVVKDAVVPVVNANNPHLARIQAQGMTQATFESIWTGGIATWGEALGDPSITDEIHVFTRSDACGAADTWAAYLGGHRQEELQGVAVYGDPGVASAVAQDPLAIGYNNLNFAYDLASGQPVAGLQVVPIDTNGDGRIGSDESFYATQSALIAAIGDGRYPSPPARPLHLVTLGTPDGLTLAFLRWVLTDGQAFVTESGYIPLTAEQLQAELVKLPQD